MTTAFQDLHATLEVLKALAKELGSPGIGSNRARSKEAIQLNGMHVVAFAAVEDFVRRRVLEVVQKISESGIKFSELPDQMRLFLLTETFAGVSFALERTDTAQKINLLQHEGMLFSITSDPRAKYEPSEYIFGRSSSNISIVQIKFLIEAFGMANGLKNLNDISNASGLTHLGSPDSVYGRLSKNRHRAAHSFKDEYEINQFISDCGGGILSFAFCFDTCISQASFHILSNFKNSHVHTPFLAIEAHIRKIEFNAARKAWDVYRDGQQVKALKKLGFDQYFDGAKTSCPATGDSLIAMGAGIPTAWIQPL